MGDLDLRQFVSGFGPLMDKTWQRVKYIIFIFIFFPFLPMSYRKQWVKISSA